MPNYCLYLSKMSHYIMSKHGHNNVFLQFRYGIGLVYNYLRYKATISDYFELTFYNKNHKEKLEYITSPQALEFAKYVDSLDSIIKYNSKTLMYKALGSFIDRDQYYTEKCSFDEFANFCKKHPAFIYKPDKEDCGHGISKWTIDTDNINEKYKEAIAAPAVLDELVFQNSEMAKLCPSCVNTVRLYSLIINKECVFFAGFLRMGRNGSIVDNLGSGGLLAGIDIETGTICTPATDDVGHCFDEHPETNIRITGFQIPGWENLLKYTKKAALSYPMKYVGWDIAVCKDGFQIIEVNPNPMIHGIQTEFFGGRKKQFDDFKRQIEIEKNCDYTP